MKSKANHNVAQSISMGIIKVCRKLFINTWLQRLPFMEYIYRKVFYFGREIKEEEINFRDYRLLVHTKDITMVPSLISGQFEKYELDLFSQIVKPGMNVIDIGANIGVYAILASKQVGSKGKVFAFEPVPENFAMLNHNLNINNVNNVETINNAVGAIPGTVRMAIVQDSLATHYIGKSGSSDNGVEVKVVTLDDFIKKNKIEVNLIKMDIEGYEGFAFEGAKKTLKTKDLILITEFSAEFIKRSGKDPSLVAKEIFNYFKYCYNIDEKKEQITPILSFHEMLDERNHDFIFSNNELNI